MYYVLFIVFSVLLIINLKHNSEAKAPMGNKKENYVFIKILYKNDQKRKVSQKWKKSLFIQNLGKKVFVNESLF